MSSQHGILGDKKSFTQIPNSGVLADVFWGQSGFHFIRKLVVNYLDVKLLILIM